MIQTSLVPGGRVGGAALASLAASPSTATSRGPGGPSLHRRSPVRDHRPGTSQAPVRLASLLLLASALVAAFLAAPAADAQTVYLAFGDSITAGSFDESDEPGYPAELEDLLNARGVEAVVENHGLPGETTGEGLSRIDDVLDGGGDVLLLMEGTNDVNAGISIETIRFNLDRIAGVAEARGLEVVHGTVIPRLPSANTDGSNRTTGRLAGAVRDLAWEEGRNLADPFRIFFEEIPDAFATLYAGGNDRLHLNAEGYDRLAQVWADVLTGRDEVPPVTGEVSPFDDQQNVPASAEVRIDLYDFGAGIDTAATELRINDEPVNATISGDGRRQQIRYTPPEPFVGVVFVGLSAQDLQVPPNSREGTIAQFVVQGTRFLPGDISRDGRVDGEDLVAFARTFGARRGDGRYAGFADFNGDDVIDGEDLAILAANFGRSSF